MNEEIDTTKDFVVALAKTTAKEAGKTLLGGVLLFVTTMMVVVAVHNIRPDKS